MSTLTTLRGIDVHFPFEPYECQNAYMEKVIDALNQEENAALESPTGTGKTLSLLCSSLAWLQNYKGRLNSSQAEQLALQVGAKEKGTRIAPQIIYASRTHSQLAQVVRELNKTTYKTLSVTTIASRDQLCINERVARETDNKVKAHMCRTLVGSHKCNYFNKWEKDHQITEELYKRGGKALDIEDLVSAATQYGHCPFYQSRSSRESADLILLPYNYILDPRLRNTHKIELKGNIVIFDEAHNLESVCEESTSVCFSSTDLAHCIAEAEEVLSNVMEDIETLREQKDNTTEGFGPVAKKSIEDEMNVQEIAHLIELLKRIEEEIDNLNLEPTKQEQKLELKGKLFKGEEMKKLLERAHYRSEMREPIALLIDRISQYLSKKAETGGAFSQTGKSLQEFSSFVSTVSADTFHDIQRLPDGTVVKQDDPTKSFYLYAEKDAETNKRKLNYWCFSAGVAMRFLQSRGVRSIIITSGTLSPLNHFISTMGIPFGITLENGHVAKPDQICAASLNVSLNMTSLNGCFQNRGTAEYKEGVGTVVLKTAQVAPQGVLVFFPSYTLMTEMLSCWKTPKRNAASSVYDQIGEAKKVFVEPRSKAALNAMFLEYDQEIRVNNGAVMFAVCRGKVSEGIDFADTHCRVVIIVGIPFPPLKDTRIVLKKYYLQEAVSQHRMKCLTPDQWYRTEGIRAINQAIGRIIRHKDDFGAVIMADPRFSKMDRREFPSWMRSTIKEYNSPMEYFSLMQRFFRDRGLACESALRRLRETYEDSLKEQKRKGDGLVAFRKRRAGQSSLDTEEDAAKRYANELMGLYQNARKLDEKEIDVVGCAIKYHERKSTKVSKLTLNEDFVGNTKNDRSAVKDLFKSIQPREAPKTGQLVAKRMIKLKSNSKVCDVNSPSTSKVALARNPSRAEATSSQTPTDIQFSSHSENRPPTTPSVSSIASKLPTISMEEYVLKIKSLSKETRKRFTDAQGVYLQTKNLRDFMELMGAALLPQHTEIFKAEANEADRMCPRDVIR
ncbi:hypothetical protein L596_014777 [Steinernema carpocapsae]|uniref:Uncharacterized protein n=1 Tax=Steinernema carpocapsae TaxID=34508 RepID=A0A4U5NE37_STECR|nr:hypothetical protein L596_014777 [Steinernema carpocapsae]